ncbi:unnamed protein product, partial [Rotaria sp. Silwood1]
MKAISSLHRLKETSTPYLATSLVPTLKTIKSLSRSRFHLLSTLPSRSRSRSNSNYRPTPPPIKPRRVHQQ